MAISAVTSPYSKKQSQRDWFSNTTAIPAAKEARKPSPPAAVALVVCLGVGLSLVYFYLEREEEQSSLQTEFEQQANTYVAAMQKGEVGWKEWTPKSE